MPKKNLFLTGILIVSLFLPQVSLKAEVNQVTVNYLFNAQAQNAWITQALKAAGQEDLDLGYLNDFEVASATDASKAVLAVVAAGQNPYNYQNENYLGLLLNYYQHNQIGSVDLVNDDFWGILALVSAGEQPEAQIIRESKNFILRAQSNDGGWGWAPAAPNQGEPAESDTNDTAAAIMALIEAGQAVDSQEIERALDYLRQLQNNDGGFPFSLGGESDAGSDAWVIAALNKLEINPATWQKNGHQPLEHLLSLGLADGSYKWLASEQTGNLLMTAYAAVALAGQSYPVAKFLPPEAVQLHHLRIEGSASTVCNAQVEGETVMAILEAGAEICDYTYNIQQTDWGPYLNRINNDQAEGLNGWLYRVNWLAAEVGMADYRLQTGESVLLYYGGWQDQPLRLGLSANSVSAGGTVTATVEYFNESSWQLAAGVDVLVGEQNYQTNNQGQAVFNVAQDGSYLIYASSSAKIRSAAEVLIVGQGSANSVVLNVEVRAGGDNDEQEEDNQDEEALAFSVNTNSLDFGALRPGGSLERFLRVTNNSGAAMYFEGVVSGDNLFKDNLRLDDRLWENYNKTVNQGDSAEVALSLIVPQNYHAGRYSANLVLWASAR